MKSPGLTPRRCIRCQNRSDIFGDRDIETGWHGYCCECNAQWRACQFNASLRSCNRMFSCVLLKGLGLNVSQCATVRQCLGLCPSILRTDTMLKHRLQGLKMLWLSAPVEWWIEDDSDAEFERYERPTLRTLQDIFLKYNSFRRHAFQALHSEVFRYVTLLDCICTYLIGADIVINQKTSRSCKYCTELPELGHDEKNLESCWQACKLGDHTVFYNAQTGECFRPPCKWQRYWYYNVHGRKKFWWCCSNRWFFEPSWQKDICSPYVMH